MSLKQQYKQRKAFKSEETFKMLAPVKSITCNRLDGIYSLSLRKKYLKDPEGKCPDFICSKNNKYVFVEVKTLTNFTNAAREKRMEDRVVEVFDPLPELKGPLRTFLKNASNKFKNIKEKTAR